MAKVDVSITRTITINTGNYQSIKPTVTLTVKDVDSGQVPEAYQALDEAATGLFQLEVVNNAMEMRKIEQGLDAYCREIVEGAEHTTQNIEDNLNKLNSL